MSPNIYSLLFEKSTNSLKIMFIYNLMLGLTVFGILFWGNKKAKMNNILYISICLIVIFAVCFRGDTIGGDTHTYRYIFEHSGKHTFYNEPALDVLNIILRYFTTNAYVYRVITGVLCLIPLFILIRKQSDDLLFSLFLFLTYSSGASLFLIEMSALRQCLAISCFCVFLILYANNNYQYNAKNIIMLVLMVLFHYSSLLVVLLLLLDRVKVKKSAYLMVSVLASFTLFYIGNYVAPLVQLAENVDKGFFLSNFENSEANLFSLFPFVASFLVSLYYMPEKETNSIWFKGYFLAVILTGFLMPIGVNVERFCAYFYLETFICMPFSFKYIPKSTIRIGFIVMLLLFFSYKYYRILDIISEQEYGITPYYTFFNQ